MRRFASRVEVDAYLDAERIECLECGRRFAFLQPHLLRAHGIGADEYRARHEIPAGAPLAGRSYREQHAQKMRRMQATGALTYDHLPDATAAARKAGRPAKTAPDAAEHARRLLRVRPQDATRLPPGARLADGRDADRAREYQRARRALLAGDPRPMAAYRDKYR